MSEQTEVIEVDQTAPEEKIIIRKLNTQDFWTIVKMVAKGGKEAIAKVQAAQDSTESVMIIFDIAMEYAENDLIKFLASIANMTEDEYKNGDFDLTLKILEQWEKQEDLSNFFKRAAGLVKKFYPSK